VRLDPLRPVRYAARSSRTILTQEAERAIDGALAGPLPEAVVRSLVEHQVVERMTPGLLGAVDSDELALRVERVLRSPEVRRALVEILTAPEVRRALTAQAGGAGDDAVDALRARARRADHRSRGFASRGLALVVDALLAQLLFLVCAASIWLVVSLAHSSFATDVARACTGAAWLLVTASYFTLSWNADGKTPGMRLMALRVVRPDGTAPSSLRAFLRFVGLVLSIATLGAGFLPALFDSRRRGLPDFLAGTVVVRAP